MKPKPVLKIIKEFAKRHHLAFFEPDSSEESLLSVTSVFFTASAKDKIIASGHIDHNELAITLKKFYQHWIVVVSLTAGVASNDSFIIVDKVVTADLIQIFKILHKTNKNYNDITLFTNHPIDEAMISKINNLAKYAPLAERTEYQINLALTDSTTVKSALEQIVRDASEIKQLFVST